MRLFSSSSSKFYYPLHKGAGRLSPSPELNMVLGRQVTRGHGCSDMGWRVSSVQGVYDYSPEAGEEAGVQAELGWVSGRPSSCRAAPPPSHNGSPSPIHLGALGSWLGVRWGRCLEEKRLIGQGHWDQPGVLRRLQVRLLLPTPAERRRPPQGDLRRGLLPPYDAWGHPLHRCSLPDLSAGRTVWGRWSQWVRKMQHLPSLASIYRGLRGAALTLM